jgi:hypothetical protein
VGGEFHAAPVPQQEKIKQLNSKNAMVVSAAACLVSQDKLC